MKISESVLNEQFKNLLQEMYTKGHASNSINLNEMLLEIKIKLKSVIEPKRI